jgi:hypothetical protein
VVATEGNDRVSVTWVPGSLNGATASQATYQYSVNGGGWRGDWVAGGSGGSGTIGNGQVNNNGSYSVRIRAVTSFDGFTEAGDPSAASNQVAPYGPIGNPSASASASGTSITVSWSSPARNGRDITTQIRINNGSWETVPASGNRTADVGYSTTRSIDVRTTAAGQTTTASASARTQDAPPPPQPRVWVSRGDRAGSCVNGCYRFVINTENFPAGNYRVMCKFEGRGYTNANVSDTAWSYNLPANGSVQLQCYLGADGYDVWVDIYDWGDGVDTEKRNWPRP